MRKLFLLLGLLSLTSQMAFARHDAKLPNPILRFIAEIEGVREFALYSLITNRCNRYLSPRSQEKACHRAVETMINHLDFDLLANTDQSLVRYDNSNPHSFIIIAFKKSLIGLLNFPKTTEYLELLRTEMNLYLSSETPHPVNLWELSVKFWKSERIAAAAIAALFQDVSPMRMHLFYLHKSGYKGKESFDTNFSLLMQVLDTFQLISDYTSAEDYQKVFYPPEIKESLNRAFYHFYVPFYLSTELKRTGTSAEFAFIAPFMMTLTYEFVTTKSDYTYLYKDPQRLDPLNRIDAYKVRDIMAGYYGVGFAQGRKAKLQSFSEIGKMFSGSTQDGVSLLLEASKP